MKRTLVIAGCGGFGREVFSIAQACRATGSELTVFGFVDDDPSEGDLAALGRLGANYLGHTSAVRGHGEHELLVAIGSGQARDKVVTNLGSAARYATLVHPDSTLGLDIRLAEGCVIAAGVRMSTNIDVGPHVHVDQNATVGHDSVLKAYARLNPQACVSGGVEVGEGALVGAGATVIQGLRVGAWAVVGAGAVVTRDVPDGAVVKGVPAR